MLWLEAYTAHLKSNSPCHKSCSMPSHLTCSLWCPAMSVQALIKKVRSANADGVLDKPKNPAHAEGYKRLRNWLLQVDEVDHFLDEDLKRDLVCAPPCIAT